MTTSTATGKCVPVSYKKGSMYAYNDLIVICCDSDNKDSAVFSGVVVHVPENGIERSQYKIGQYSETFVKFYFNEFEGEVTLKS